MNYNQQCIYNIYISYYINVLEQIFWHENPDFHTEIITILTDKTGISKT